MRALPGVRSTRLPGESGVRDRPPPTLKRGRMILTVTPNPSVDRTLEIDTYVRGAVIRIHNAMAHAGGKGVNVSRALRNHGVQTVAVLPVGGAEGAQLTALPGEHGKIGRASCRERETGMGGG